MSDRRMPAEWEEQDAVLLTWPHANSDWQRLLDDVIPLYEALVTVIADYADLVIGVPESQMVEVAQRLAAMGVPEDAVYLYPVASNDTWARDHGPLTVITEQGPQLLDFVFNGWGGKYPADLDNGITRQLYGQGAFPGASLETRGWVLEGGSIEVDGRGTLLTTSACLLNPNRNPALDKAEIERRLKQDLGVRKVNWLTHGHLQGDDTDSHIDTLARLCPDNVIAYVACDDPADEHYDDLKAMERELRELTDADGQPYRLVPLPWPEPCYSEDGDDRRLPATYANFLVINGAVLVPLYDSVTDDDALEQVAKAFPGYEIMGVPCRTLIEQGGSLHCITMQLPSGVLFS